MQLKLLIFCYSAIQERKRQLYRESSESDSGSNSTSESLDSSPERYFFGKVSNHVLRFSKMIYRKVTHTKKLCNL